MIRNRGSSMKIGDRVVVDHSSVTLWYPMQGGVGWEPASWAGTITNIGDELEGQWPEGAEVEVTMDASSEAAGGPPWLFYAYGFGSLTFEAETMDVSV